MTKTTTNVAEYNYTYVAVLFLLGIIAIIIMNHCMPAVEKKQYESIYTANKLGWGTIFSEPEEVTTGMLDITDRTDDFGIMKLGFRINDNMYSGFINRAMLPKAGDMNPRQWRNGDEVFIVSVPVVGSDQSTYFVINHRPHK